MSDTSSFTNHTPVLRPWPPTDTPKSEPLWRIAPIPTDYLPVDHISDLMNHVSPPRPPPFAYRPRGGSESQSNDQQDSQQTGPVDEQQSQAPPDPVPGLHPEVTIEPPDVSIHIGNGDAESTRPLKRAKVDEKYHTRRPSSASQRKSESAHSKYIWKALHDKLEASEVEIKIKFTSALDLLGRCHDTLHDDHIVQSPPNTAPGYCSNAFNIMCSEERMHSYLTAAGEAKMEAGAKFRTYQERLSVLGTEGVQLKSCGPGDLANQFAALDGIARLANDYVADPRNVLQVPHRHYAFSLNLKTGRADISALRIGASYGIGYTTEDATPQIVEKKTFTYREILCLVMSVRDGLACSFDGEKWVIVGKGAALICVASKLLLFQIIQELHVNKARFLLLETHDLNVLFELKSPSDIAVSGLLFRDPAEFAPKFSDATYLEQLLHLVAPDSRKRMVNRFSKGGTLSAPVDPPYSLFSIYVYGLLASTRGLEKVWITEEEIGQAGQAIRQGADGATPAQPDPTTPSASSSSTSPGHTSPDADHNSKRTVDTLAEHDLRADSRWQPVKCPFTIDQKLVAKIKRLRELDRLTHFVYFARIFGSAVWNRDTSVDNRIRRMSPCKQYSNDSGNAVDPAYKPSSPVSLLSPPADQSGIIRDALDGRGNIQVVAHAGSGRLWDAYRAIVCPAVHRASSPVDVPRCPSVILKFCVPASYGDNDNSFRSDSAYQWPDEAVEALHNEVELLTLSHAELQGVLFPRVYGLFKTRQPAEVWCLVIEDCGSRLDAGGRRIRPSDIQAIRELYQQLHGAGILHRDIKRDHILVNDAGRVRLIDFEGAIDIRRSKLPPQVATEMMEDELRWVDEVMSVEVGAPQ